MEDSIKKLLIAILVVLVINTVFVASLLFGGVESSSVVDTTQTEDGEYDTSKVEAIDYSKFEELFNNEEKSIVLFARSSCGYCVQFMPILNEVIEERDLKVYYIDITTMTDENVTSIKALDTFFEENYGYTPALAVVSNGQVVANNVGYIEKEELDSFIDSLSTIE